MPLLILVASNSALILTRARKFLVLLFLEKMNSSSRSGGNVENALLAFSKEEGGPRSWFLGIFLFRHFHRLLVLRGSSYQL